MPPYYLELVTAQSSQTKSPWTPAFPALFLNSFGWGYLGRWHGQDARSPPGAPRVPPTGTPPSSVRASRGPL